MTESYGRSFKLLHWSLAAVLIALITVGFWMEGLPRGDLKSAVYGLHKSFGVLALALVALRIGWRLTRGVPNPPTFMPAWQLKSAHAAHLALYALMLALPVAGMVMSWSGGHPVGLFGLQFPALIGKNEALHEAMEGAHAVMGVGLAVLVAGHAAAALWHHFVAKDDVLLRMSPLGGRQG